MGVKKTKDGIMHHMMQDANIVKYKGPIKKSHLEEILKNMKNTTPREQEPYIIVGSDAVKQELISKGCNGDYIKILNIDIEL